MRIRSGIQLVAPILTALVAAACSSQPATPPPDAATAAPPAPKVLTGQERVNWYQDCWGRFNVRSWESFKACYDPGIVSEEMDAGPPPANGPDAVIAAAQKNTVAFPDMKGTQQLILVNGNNIASLSLLNGTHAGPLEGPGGKAVPATNKKVGYVFAHVVTTDGTGQKALQERAYYDLGTVVAQIGVSPAPSRPVMEPGAGAPIVAVASGSDVEAKNAAAFRAQMEAFNTHDLAAVESFNTPDAVFHDYTSPADTDSKGNAAMVSGLFKGFPDARLTTSALWSAGDYVVAEGTFEGTNTGPVPAMGIKKPTTRPVRVRFIEITRYRDGKIAEDWLIFNGMAFAIQLGLTGS